MEHSKSNSSVLIQLVFVQCLEDSVGLGGGGEEVGEIHVGLVKTDFTQGTPFNVVSSVLPVILALRHDVDFAFLAQVNA